ncbi:MAG: ComF family protein [Alphaproteobacteria bacterium]|nr:ComF family protein [Alphaproteobacteria bacterium]
MRQKIGPFLDFVLPPLCLMCDEPVGEAATLCPTCWKTVQFIDAPFCVRCGIPFDVPMGNDTLCATCLTAPPPYEKARSALLYDDASRRLILGFKHGDRLHVVQALAQWMARSGHDLWENADVLVPVPLHRWRLFHRRYNQAALLAKELSRLTKKPFLPDSLCRTRKTASQGRLTRKERQQNVKGAFAVPTRKRQNIEGKSVVLIDDVMTTGATVEECAWELLGSGARAVYVLTLARRRRVEFL